MPSPVSITKLTGISAQSAALATLMAVATNMVSKLVVGVLIGSGRFALGLAGFGLACLVAAGIAVWNTFSFVPPWERGLLFVRNAASQRAGTRVCRRKV